MAAPLPPAPEFTFTSHLETLLPTPKRLTRITNAEESMTVLATATDLNDGSPNLTPAECGGAFEPARRSAYADSGSTGVSMQLVADDKPGQAAHVVSQAVVSFTDVDAAFNHLNTAAETFVHCGGKSISVTNAAGDVRKWKLGAPALHRDKTVLVQVQTGPKGSCERAMTASSLGGAAIVADVMACNFDNGDVAGQAEEIAVAISSNAAQRTP